MSKADIASYALIKTGVKGNDYLNAFVRLSVQIFLKNKKLKITEKQFREKFNLKYALNITDLFATKILNKMLKLNIIAMSKDDNRHAVYSFCASENNFDDLELENIEDNYKYFIDRFIAYCSENEGIEIKEEDAQNAVLKFTNKSLDNSIPSRLLIDFDENKDGITENEFLFQKFLRYCNNCEIKVYEFYEKIYMGGAFANFLSFSGGDRSDGSLNGLTFYLDTDFLFNFLGLDPYDDYSEEYEQLVSALIGQGSVIKIFRHTYDEMLDIIKSCEKWLKVDSDFDSSIASRVCIYMKNNDYEPEQIDELILNIEDKFNEFNIEIDDMDYPTTKPNQNVYEENIFEEIKKYYLQKNDEINEKTVRIDARSLFFIYSKRDYRNIKKISNSRFLFVTTNKSLAKIALRYEKNRTDDYDTIPVAITASALEIMALLHVKEDENKLSSLLPQSLFALNPNEQLMEKFNDALTYVKDTGKMSANIANRLRYDTVLIASVVDKYSNDAEKITCESLEETFNDYLDRKTDAKRDDLRNKIKALNERRMKISNDLEIEKSKKKQCEKYNHKLRIIFGSLLGFLIVSLFISAILCNTLIQNEKVLYYVNCCVFTIVPAILAYESFMTLIIRKNFSIVSLIMDYLYKSFRTKHQYSEQNITDYKKELDKINNDINKTL